MKTSVKWFKIGFAFLLGLLFIISPLYAYRGNYAFAYELTFLSNFLSGIFMGIVGILMCFDKKVPQFLFLDFAILLLIVFFVTVSFSGNFKMTGVMFILHIINPVLAAAYYLVFSDQTATEKKFVPTALVMPVLYLVFSLLYGTLTGNYIYFFLDYEQNGIGYMCLFLSGISAGTVLVSFFLYDLNRLFRKQIR